MKKTQRKIIDNALMLFNTKGVGNVRLQDISESCGISSGNLSYHYKTKKELIQEVLVAMESRFSAMNGENLSFLEGEAYGQLINNYLNFQIEHRFFSRDILEVMNLIPDAKLVYEKQMKQAVTFTKHGIKLAIGKGMIKPEPHEGHYGFFAKNIWGILQAWLAEREVFGEENVSLEKIKLAVWEFHFPYFTPTGLEAYNSLKSQILNNQS